MLSHLVQALETTALLSTAVSAAVGMVAARRTLPVSPAGPRSRLPAALFHPFVQLLLVCALLHVNQVLFSAYVLRAHGGSTAFIARFVPGPWWAIGRHDPLVHAVLPFVGDGQWLAPTLLRVQAFLELPFTMLAYLAVARLLGRRLYASLTHPLLLLLVAVSFSVTFSIIEVALTNPYTHDDLVLRALGAVLTPVYLAWVSRAEHRRAPPLGPGNDGPRDVLGLLVFLAGAGAIAHLVLGVYDVYLLYNLAHLPAVARGLGLAVVIAGACSVLAPRVDALVGRGAPTASVAAGACLGALRIFTLAFFLPSLAIRYGGTLPSAAFCGFAVAGVGAAGGLVAALRSARNVLAAAAQLAFTTPLALGLGGYAGYAMMASTGAGALPELVLLRASLSFLAVTIVVLRALEIALCWALHETKAPADEA